MHLPYTVMPENGGEAYDCLCGGLQLKPGDRVITSKYSGTEVKYQNEEYVIVRVGASYYGAWLCRTGKVTGFFGIGTFDAEVQNIADVNADGTADLLLRTASGVVGAALITGADATAWSEYGALGAEWSTRGAGIL